MGGVRTDHADRAAAGGPAAGGALRDVPVWGATDAKGEGMNATAMNIVVAAFGAPSAG
ncbi:hypothetical protein ACFC0C_34465 [Streptomyces sp. NPDC056178]|uniref:hypothetical protein n=1 Tax=Streptomyces sp. NPDC056178 TaxID=3345735 RepID=UPI0035E3B9E8